MGVNVHDGAAIAEAYIVGGKMNSKKSKKKAHTIIPESVKEAVAIADINIAATANPAPSSVKLKALGEAVPSFSTKAAAEAVSSAVDSARTAAWDAKSAARGAVYAKDAAWAAHKELLSSHDQDIISIRKDMKELQGDMGRIVKLLAQVLGGDFATEANTILTKRQEVS